jgi:hypothetical protein
MSSVNSTTPRAVRRWIETFAIAASGAAIGLASHRHDASWFPAALPWLYVLPIASGLRSGPLHGVACGALLASFGLLYVGEFTSPLTGFAINCLVIGVLAGQIRAARARRRELQDEPSPALPSRRPAHTAELERLSQARLDQRTVAAHLSLAAAIETAGRRMQELATRRELTELLLEVLASQAMVQAASIYWSDGQALGAKPVARLGENGAATHEHPLVQRAFTTRRLAALVDPAAQLGSADLNVLIAVPLISVNGRLLGVLAVHQMPFMALQTEPLRSVLAITRQLSELIEQRIRALPYAASPSPAPPPSARPEASSSSPSSSSPPPAAEPSRDRAVTQRPVRPRGFERNAAPSCDALAIKR